MKTTVNEELKHNALLLNTDHDLSDGLEGTLSLVNFKFELLSARFRILHYSGLNWTLKLRGNTVGATCRKLIFQEIAGVVPPCAPT